MRVDSRPIAIEQVEACTNGNLKANAEEFLLALEGVVTDLQRELLGEVLHVIDEQTAQIQRAEALIDKYFDASYSDAVEAIDELPGIAKTSAQQIVAEISTDITRFPSADHLCSWAGLSPGNNESAGKRRSGKTLSAKQLFTIPSILGGASFLRLPIGSFLR